MQNAFDQFRVADIVKVEFDVEADRTQPLARLALRSRAGAQIALELSVPQIGSILTDLSAMLNELSAVSRNR